MKIFLWFSLLVGILSVGPVSAKSRCVGTTASGSLVDGVRLPMKGQNFVSYSTLASIAGRTYVHSVVHDIVISSYQALYKQDFRKVYKYAETGFQSGGLFKPHKTHRNGLSVDFMVPVVSENGMSEHLPTNVLNRLGYDIDFDSAGSYEEYSIDFESMGAHLVALDQSAKSAGYSLWRVIFDPKLQPYLLATSHGEYIKNNIQLSTKSSWVRHDEHYHVDFNVPCEAL